MRSNEFIIEATYELDKDVDMLYDMAFKETIDQIQAGTWDGKYNIPGYLAPTSVLVSPDAKKADKINPVDIITIHGNEYNPHGDGINGPYISISINRQVLDYISLYGSIENVLEHIPLSQHKRFKTELTPERIKGSIHHELSHWIDDTLHNSHIKNRLTWARQAAEKHQNYKKASNIMTQGKKDVGLSNYELNAQIHAIKQLKRAHEDLWDLLSFDEMINLNPSLSHLSDTLKSHGEYENWKKHLLRRMYREKLLGKEMYRSL